MMVRLKTERFIPCLVIVVGLTAYANSLRDSFVFDDLPRIVENPHIRRLWSLGEIWAYSSRPVVQLSLAANYALGGLNPWGYHLFNVCVHILAALTLYAVVRLTFLSEALRSCFGNAASWLAGMVALIWLVHPLQTESVTYTIQRGESLMGLFYLLTLYCVIRSTARSGIIWWQVAAVASCALGMGSKPVMVTAPVIILLYDRVFLAGSFRGAFRQRLWLYCGLAATWLLLPVLLRNGSEEWKATAGLAYHAVSPLEYALTETGVILHYLRLAFWPHPLCLDYGWQYDWPLRHTVQNALPELTVVGMLLGGTLWAWWRKPALGFLGVWFFVILAPTSSFVPVADLVVEHRMYLPLAAVVVITTVGVFTLGRYLLSARQETQRMLEYAVSGVVVLVLTALTIQRNRDYRSEFVIWQDTILKRPNNPRAHYNLGVVLRTDGRNREEVEQYVEALRLKPDYAEAHNNFGNALHALGKESEAIEHYEQALQIKPDYDKAHYNLGVVLLQQGKLDAAIKHLEQAIRIRPDYAEAHYNLGLALAQSGKLQEAIGQYEQALLLRPGYAEAHDNLAVALIRRGKVPEAVEHWEQVVRFKPDNAEAHYNLGLALVQIDKPQEAIGHYEQFLRLKPDSAEAHNNLAWLLATLAPATGGDPLRAVTLAQRGCEITGYRKVAYLDTLAVAYAAAGRFDDAMATAQKAVELARAAGQTQVAKEIEGRLEMYRGGRAYQR